MMNEFFLIIVEIECVLVAGVITQTLIEFEIYLSTYVSLWTRCTLAAASWRNGESGLVGVDGGWVA